MLKTQGSMLKIRRVQIFIWVEAGSKSSKGSSKTTVIAIDGGGGGKPHPVPVPWPVVHCHHHHHHMKYVPKPVLVHHWVKKLKPYEIEATNQHSIIQHHQSPNPYQQHSFNYPYEQKNENFGMEFQSSVPYEEARLPFDIFEGSSAAASLSNLPSSPPTFDAVSSPDDRLVKSHLGGQTFQDYNLSSHTSMGLKAGPKSPVSNKKLASSEKAAQIKQIDRLAKQIIASSNSTQVFKKKPFDAFSDDSFRSIALANATKEYSGLIPAPEDSESVDSQFSESLRNHTGIQSTFESHPNLQRGTSTEFYDQLGDESQKVKTQYDFATSLDAHNRREQEEAIKMFEKLSSEHTGRLEALNIVNNQQNMLLPHQVAFRPQQQHHQHAFPVAPFLVPSEQGAFLNQFNNMQPNLNATSTPQTHASLSVFGGPAISPRISGSQLHESHAIDAVTRLAALMAQLEARKLISSASQQALQQQGRRSILSAKDGKQNDSNSTSSSSLFRSSVNFLAKLTPHTKNHRDRRRTSLSMFPVVSPSIFYDNMLPARHRSVPQWQAPFVTRDLSVSGSSPVAVNSQNDDITRLKWPSRHSQTNPVGANMSDNNLKEQLSAQGSDPTSEVSSPNNPSSALKKATESPKNETYSFSKTRNFESDGKQSKTAPIPRPLSGSISTTTPLSSALESKFYQGQQEHLQFNRHQPNNLIESKNRASSNDLMHLYQAEKLPANFNKAPMLAMENVSQPRKNQHPLIDADSPPPIPWHTTPMVSYAGNFLAQGSPVSWGRTQSSVLQSSEFHPSHWIEKGTPQSDNEVPEKQYRIPLASYLEFPISPQQWSNEAFKSIGNEQISAGSESSESSKMAENSRDENSEAQNEDQPALDDLETRNPPKPTVQYIDLTKGSNQASLLSSLQQKMLAEQILSSLGGEPPTPSNLANHQDTIRLPLSTNDLGSYSVERPVEMNQVMQQTNLGMLSPETQGMLSSSSKSSTSSYPEASMMEGAPMMQTDSSGQFVFNPMTIPTASSVSPNNPLMPTLNSLKELDPTSIPESSLAIKASASKASMALPGPLMLDPMVNGPTAVDDINRLRQFQTNLGQSVGQGSNITTMARLSQQLRDQMRTLQGRLPGGLPQMPNIPQPPQIPNLPMPPPGMMQMAGLALPFAMARANRIRNQQVNAAANSGGTTAGQRFIQNAARLMRPRRRPLQSPNSTQYSNRNPRRRFHGVLRAVVDMSRRPKPSVAHHTNRFSPLSSSSSKLKPKVDKVSDLKSHRLSRSINLLQIGGKDIVPTISDSLGRGNHTQTGSHLINFVDVEMPHTAIILPDETRMLARVVDGSLGRFASMTSPLDMLTRQLHQHMKSNYHNVGASRNIVDFDDRGRRQSEKPTAESMLAGAPQYFQNPLISHETKFTVPDKLAGQDIGRAAGPLSSPLVANHINLLLFTAQNVTGNVLKIKNRQHKSREDKFAETNSLLRQPDEQQLELQRQHHQKERHESLEQSHGQGNPINESHENRELIRYQTIQPADSLDGAKQTSSNSIISNDHPDQPPTQMMIVEGEEPQVRQQQPRSELKLIDTARPLNKDEVGLNKETTEDAIQQSQPPQQPQHQMQSQQSNVEQSLLKSIPGSPAEIKRLDEKVSLAESNSSSPSIKMAQEEKGAYASALPSPSPSVVDISEVKQIISSPQWISKLRRTTIRPHETQIQLITASIAPSTSSRPMLFDVSNYAKERKTSRLPLYSISSPNHSAPSSSPSLSRLVTRNEEPQSMASSDDYVRAIKLVRGVAYPWPPPTKSSNILNSVDFGSLIAESDPGLVPVFLI